MGLRRASLALLLAGAISGTLPVDARPAPDPDRFTVLWGGYKLTKPAGWNCVQPSKGGTQLICSDLGSGIHSFTGQRLNRGEASDIAGLDLSQPASPDQIAAGVFAQASKQDPSLKLLDSKAVEVAGLPAFRIEFERINDNGLRLRGLRWGIVTKDGLHQFTYGAPALIYFERDRAAIEAAVATIQLFPPQRP